MADGRGSHQQSKCINEKRRRELENVYIEELAELISAKLSDMNSLAIKPDKCAILQETVKQIRFLKPEESDLQATEVSSSKPTLLASDVLGPLLLEALDGFLFIVNQDGKIEFVSENVSSFLNFKQTELIGETIYNIVHHGDHARFSSNLLPMSAIGNGFAWCATLTSTAPGGAAEAIASSSTSGTAVASSSSLVATVGQASGPSQSKSRIFNTRFLVKGKQKNNSDSDEDEDMFGVDGGYAASSSISSNSDAVYENMQISAVLLPLTKDQSTRSSSSGSHHSVSTGESDNMSLVCVARRNPQTERTPANTLVEQFSTRLDLMGKILAVDTSYVTSHYSQYLNNDLLGKSILELCHDQDWNMLNSHLKEALKTGKVITSKVYRIRVAPGRYVAVQTKSKFWREDQHVMAAHSIIRDSESQDAPVHSQSNPNAAASVSGGVSSAPTPTANRLDSASSSSRSDPLPGSMLDNNSRSTSSTSATGSSTNEIVSTSNAQASTPFTSYTAMSPSTNVVTSDLLNDCLGLSDMFPSSSWSDYDTNPDPNPTLSSDQNPETPASNSQSDSMSTSVSITMTTSHNSNNNNHHGDSMAICRQQGAPTSLSSLISSPQLPPSYLASSASSSSATNSSVSLASGIGVPSIRSPTRTGTPSSTTASPRATTPFAASSSQNQSVYSPVQKSSPSHTQAPVPSPAHGSGISTLNNSSAVSNTNAPNNNNNNSNFKLRNLLTQSGSVDERPLSASSVNAHHQVNSNLNATPHDILRDLLNQDDDDDFGLSGPSSAPSLTGGMSTPNPSTQYISSQSAAPTPTSSSAGFSFDTSTISCPTSASEKKELNSGNNVAGGNNNSGGSSNNMLRKLLNDDDTVKSYRSKSNQDILIHHLLGKDDSSQNSGEQQSMNQSYPPSSSTLQSSLSDVLMSPQTSGNSFRFGPGSVKRKSVDEHYGDHMSASGSQPSTPQSQHQQQGGSFEYPANKRPVPNTGQSSNAQVPTTASAQPKQSQQLAGQNPMLASMLAQTPRTLPAAPITIPTSIVTQVPQERLPKNLDKKFIHTPAGQAGENTTIVVSSHIVTSATSGGVVSLSATAQQLQHHQLQQQQHPFVTGQQAIRNAARPTLQPQVGVTVGQRFAAQQQQLPENQLHGLTQQQHRPAGIQSQQQSNFLTKILQDGPRASGLPVQSNLVSGAYFSQQPNPVQAPLTPLHGGLGTSGGHLINQPTHLPPQASSAPNVSFVDMQSSMNSMEHANDPILSDILDQVWSMEEELSIDGRSSSASQSISMSADDTNGLFRLLIDEVLEPSAPNIATPATPTQQSVSAPSTPGTPGDLNEKLAISAIQRQLMSFESGHGQQQGGPRGPPQMFASNQNSSFSSTGGYQVSGLGPPPAYSAAMHQQQPPGQAGNPPQRRAVPVMSSSMPQISQTPTQIIQHRPNPQQQFVAPSGGYSSQPPSPAPGAQPGMIGLANSRKPIKPDQRQLQFINATAKRNQLLQQQQHQELTMQTPQSHGQQVDPSGFDNLADLLNTSVPPNVNIQLKTRNDNNQVSPRFSSTMSTGPTLSSSPLPQSPAPGHPHSTPPQLMSGQRGSGGNAPYSPMSYPSPSPSAPQTPTYAASAQHRMSPHPYSNVSSPHGPNSPAHHLQSLASPQPSTPSSTQGGWIGSTATGQSVRVSAPANNAQQQQQQQQGNNNVMQQRNPMLNAQLSGFNSQGGNAAGGQQQQQQVRFTPRPPTPQASTRPLTSPSPMSRNSPAPYPPSPGIYQSGSGNPQQIGGQQQQQQPRLVQLNPQTQPQIQGPQQRVIRLNSTRFINNDGSGIQGFSGGFQGQGIPVQMELRNTVQSQQQQFINFDQQRAQGSNVGASDFVKQELRAMVGARTQMHQQPQMSISQPSNTTTTSSSSPSMSFNVASQLDSDDLAALGLSLELSEETGLGFSSDAPESPRFSTVLANLTGETSSPVSVSSSPMTLSSVSMAQSSGSLSRSQSVNSPRLLQDDAQHGLRQNQEQKPNTSLLQQLLSSEPP
ncbi:Nuclear receptor coactivator 2 [Halotydeus destructor]|nr:Nuclear receptor coactivator 2 [Halotydeus destructor]